MRHHGFSRSSLYKVTPEQALRNLLIDDHIKSNWTKAKELFDEFSQRVLELDPRIEIYPVKNYIGFIIENKNVIDIKIRESKLLLELLRVEPKDLIDPEKRTRYKARSFEYYNKHISEFDINNEYDINYALMLVKQVYKRFVE